MRQLINLVAALSLPTLLGGSGSIALEIYAPVETDCIIGTLIL